MSVIEISGHPRVCGSCEIIRKEEIAFGQTIELFFDEATLTRRKLHQFNGVSVAGVVKSIHLDDRNGIYSVIFENSTLFEIITSSIKKIVLMCEKCAKDVSSKDV